MGVTRQPRKWGTGLLLLLLVVPPIFSPERVLEAELRSIALYQRVGSPVSALVTRCRFRPTCSHYALQVLPEEGLWKGNLRLGLRLLLCSPLGAAADLLRGRPLGPPPSPGQDQKVTTTDLVSK